ncbi:MAG: hypothetical protein KC535_02205 [Nanoarchaeota archaeon]|nr:hypothetical protein [Nanoarchaeota archaeon]
MYATTNKKHAILLGLVFLFILSSVGLLIVLDWESPTGHLIAQGGNISNMSISQDVFPSYWSLIYGSFDESTGIDDHALFPSQVVRVNSSSYGYDSSMVVLGYSGSLNLSDISQAPPALIDAYLGVGPVAPESGTNTFDTLFNITIGSSTHELYGVQTHSYSGVFLTAAFLSGGNLGFVATTQNASGFDNTSTFFQLLLPVSIFQNYSLQPVSSFSCPSSFFINATMEQDNVTVRINWTPVSGAIKYRIFYADGLSPLNYMVFDPLNSTNTTDTFFTEIPSSSNRFYRVQAVLPTVLCSSNNTVGTYTLPLVPDANLISFPFSFVNNSVAEVLRPIKDSFTAINEYDNLAQSYKFYIQFSGSIFKNFDTIELGKGYWLTVNESVNLTMVGTVTDQLSEPVYNRSNLVGFPLIQGNNSVAYVLRSIDGSYSSVNVYDNVAKLFHFYIIFFGSVFSDFDTIEPTGGYWIYANESKTITLP